MRRELRLPFAILCDTNKRVIQDWDIYNPKERGGIAKPAVFIIDRNRTVLFASVDTVNARVPAADIVRILQTRDKEPVDARAISRARWISFAPFAMGLDCATANTFPTEQRLQSPAWLKTCCGPQKLH